MELSPVKANLDAKADLTPLANAGANLIDSPRKGIGKVLNTWMGRWFAKTDRDIALLNAQTIRDCQLIAEGKMEYREGKLLPVPDLSSVKDVYTVLHALNHQADAKRLGAAITEVARQLADIPDDQISDEPLSQTFFNRWRREAEMIDEEDLRQFWASLLVEETKQPGSISPRTLDVARNLSRDEAKLFEQMVKDVFEKALIVDGKSVPPGCGYIDKIRLQDAGLVGSEDSQREFQVHSDGGSGKPFADIVFQDDRYLIRCFGDKVQVSCHVLTTAGVELMKILSVRRTQEDVVAIAKAIADQKKHSLVEVHKVTSIEPGDSGGFGYRYEIDPVWTTKKV